MCKKGKKAGKSAFFPGDLPLFQLRDKRHLSVGGQLRPD